MAMIDCLFEYDAEFGYHKNNNPHMATGGHAHQPTPQGRLCGLI